MTPAIAILAVAHAEAPEVVTSAWIDEQLADTYDRVGVRAGILADVAGIVERRWWPASVTFDEAAARAGASALAASGVDPADIDLLISTSVCKHNLEPSVACSVHDRLGLPATCVNYDLGNACVGFVNAMDVAAAAIETGRARHVLIVDGEGSRQIQENTISRLLEPDATKADVFDNFASLTLGSGAAAMVLGAVRSDEHHPVYEGSITRAATAHNQLCVGSLDRMRTDTAGLLVAGLALAQETALAAEAAGLGGRNDYDMYVLHQVSSVHTSELCKLVGIDEAKVPLTYPRFGNIGPAAIPYTLAMHQHALAAGDRVLLCGIGSGLNCSLAEVAW